MTKIAAVLAVPATGAYYYTDLLALHDHPIPLTEQYSAQPATPGFHQVREVAEAVSVGLVLQRDEASSDGSVGPRVVWGDCVSVAYGGTGGREPAFRAVAGLRSIRDVVAPVLRGRHLSSFRELATEIDGLIETVDVPAAEAAQPADSEAPSAEGVSRRDLLAAPWRWLREADGEEDQPPEEMVTVERALHSATRYGVSQALLKAAAVSTGQTMAEVIAGEWALAPPSRPVPVHAQSGAERRKNADKMILRRVDSLPHGLIEDIPEQLGMDGEALVRYVGWLKSRLEWLAGPDYRPTIHLDVHGALGRIYDNNLGRILGYLHRLESQARPYALRVESPVVMGSRAAQIEALGTLREYAQFRDLGVEIVADEWANTLDDVQTFVAAEAADMIHIKMPDLGSVHNSVEAVLACHRGGIRALLGGSCAETELSARVSAHVALATGPDLVMAKPGMGVDEGVSLMRNEMTRTLASISLPQQQAG